MTKCPCCGLEAAIPALDDLIVSSGLTGYAAAVLRAVWRARGASVMAERLFDEMYADDVNGGPSPTRMYQDLNKSISTLNRSLDPYDMSVVKTGYRKGWRLEINSFDSVDVF